MLRQSKAPQPLPPAPGTRYRFRFGQDAEFDAARLELRVQGRTVPLQAKPLELLALLLATPGEVLSKQAILDTLWAEREVVEAVLANAASKLRAALGAANAGCIVTVARQGYRLEGPVERIAHGRRLVSALALARGDAVPGRAGHRLLRQLGASPGQETWLAEQPKTGDTRVFKFALDGERLAALQREATISRLLERSLGRRADLVRVLDMNFEEPPFWIETEYAGDDLEAWCNAAAGAASSVAGTADSPHAPNPGRLATPTVPGRTRLQSLPLAERIALVRQVADALAAAHRAQVLHKDLKPANVLVQPLSAAAGEPARWQVRLGDFGSGRLLDPAELERLRVTRLGLTLDSLDSSPGTPLYIAPELLGGGAATPASDVFALGVVLYQMLAGELHRPLAPGWERDIADELLREDIALATDIDPARRLGSAAELAERLSRLPERRALREAERVRAELDAAQRAAAELARQNAVAETLNRLLREDLIGAANPGLQGRADITVADALTGAAARIDTKYAALEPALRAHLHTALQHALADLSRSKDAVEAGQRAVRAWGEALAAARAEQSAAPVAADALSAVQQALESLQKSRLRLTIDLVQLSQLAEAAAVVQAIDADAPPPAEQEPIFRARLLFAKSWLTAGDLSLQESLAQLEEAATLVSPFSEEQAPSRSVILFGLADNLALVGRLAEAEALYRQLLGEHVQRHGEQHVRSRYTQVGLGNVLARLGRYDEARAEIEPAAAGLAAALGARHRQTLTARDMLADLRFRQRDFAGAAREWAEVQAGYAELMGEGSSYTLTVQTQHAAALLRAGQAAAAEPLLRRALTLARAFLAHEAPQVQQIRCVLAECLLELDGAAEAQCLAEGLQPAALALAEADADWPARLASLHRRTAAGSAAAAQAGAERTP
ncbi:MAG: winged helix-turn-helix domain-containing protein [Rubrivivax sp.]|nr:winged helix-turn-helix domain-containing protein [Rubrivivax sp.]